LLFGHAGAASLFTVKYTDLKTASNSFEPHSGHATLFSVLSAIEALAVNSALHSEQRRS